MWCIHSARLVTKAFLPINHLLNFSKFFIKFFNPILSRVGPIITRVVPSLNKGRPVVN